MIHTRSRQLLLCTFAITFITALISPLIGVEAEKPSTKQQQELKTYYDGDEEKLKTEAQVVKHGTEDDGTIIDLPYLFAKNYSGKHPNTPRTPGQQYSNLLEFHPTTVRLEGSYLSSSTYENWVKSPYITPDWDGQRTLLKKQGFTFVGSYLNNALGNPTGGTAQEFKMNQQVAIAINLDFEKMLGIYGLSFQGAGRWRGGGDLAQAMGATGILDPTASYGSQGFRLQNLFLREELWDGRIELRAGRQIPNQIFAVMPVSFVYVNDALNGGIVGFSDNFAFTSGDSSWGVFGKIHPDEERETYVVSAVYYMPSGLGEKTNHGINMTFNAENAGTLIMAEAGYLPNTNPNNEAGLPGQYLFGGYSVTGDTISQVNPSNSAAAIWGLYAGAAQMIYREGKAGGHQGLSLWGSFSYSPQNITVMPYSLAVGAMYQGLIPGRNEDQLGLGFWWGYFSRDIPVSASEPPQTSQEVIELTYAIALTPWFYIQPDFQYIFDPAGNGTVDDAMILGVQTSVNF